jgi:hypothetical protein
MLTEFVAGGVSIAQAEAAFLVPILLWNIPTQSDAYSELLVRIGGHCRPGVYGQSLLLSLELQHSVVISTVFEELEKLESISAIEPQLRELLVHPNSVIREHAKTALSRTAPRSPHPILEPSDPVELLQSQIRSITETPDQIPEPTLLFCSLLDQFQGEMDERQLRYLLYATYAFLAEPVLSVAVKQRELLTLVQVLCEFSLAAPAEFAEALDAIGFVLVNVISQVALFEVLLRFFDNHISELDRKSFPFQLFSVGVSLLVVSNAPNDLKQLRAFAKSVISRGSLGKDDLRAILCRSLLAEIVSLEQQKLIGSDPPPSTADDHVERELVKPKRVPKKPVEPVPDKLLFVSILRKITEPQTKSEGIAELIEFDESVKDDVVGVVLKLAPSLKRELDDGHRSKSKR